MRARSLVGTVGALLVIVGAAFPAAHGAPPPAMSTNRIASPGVDERVNNVLARMPALYRHILATNLRYLGFVDTIPCQGMRPAANASPAIQFNG